MGFTRQKELEEERLTALDENEKLKRLFEQMSEENQSIREKLLNQNKDMGTNH